MVKLRLEQLLFIWLMPMQPRRRPHTGLLRKQLRPLLQKLLGMHLMGIEAMGV